MHPPVPVPVRVWLRSDGTPIHLYPGMLALLLRLSSRGGESNAEIARRTKEVLDQFERNGEQQQFFLTIFETLDRRSRAEPQSFDGVRLRATHAVHYPRRAPCLGALC